MATLIDWFLKPARMIALIACALLAVQTVRLNGEKRHSEKLQVRVNELVAQAEAIRKAGKESKARTERVIVQVEGSAKDAETRARRVESAPTVEGCKTPPEVLSSDL